VPVICASDKTPLKIFPGDRHAWPLYHTIGNIRKDIHHTPKKHAWILVGLIPFLPQGAENIDNAWYSTVGTVLSQRRHLEIAGPGLRWDCADGFQQQCNMLLAAWVGEYSKQVMVAQVSYGSCLMCKILKGVPMGPSTFRPLDNSRDQHIDSELLENNNIDALHTVCVHPIRNQFWQFPLCNVHRLWQLDELHQPLLGLVEDILHRLLKYLTARLVKDQFDNRFTLVLRYPCLQHFSEPFECLKSGTLQGKKIRDMIRTLAVNCSPILVGSMDDGNTAGKTASDEMVKGAVRAFC